MVDRIVTKFHPDSGIESMHEAYVSRGYGIGHLLVEPEVSLASMDYVFKYSLVRTGAEILGMHNIQSGTLIDYVPPTGYTVQDTGADILMLTDTASTLENTDPERLIKLNAAKAIE